MYYTKPKEPGGFKWDLLWFSHAIKLGHGTDALIAMLSRTSVKCFQQ